MIKIIKPGQPEKGINPGLATVPGHSGGTPWWYRGCPLLLTTILMFCLNGFMFARQSGPIRISSADSSRGSLPLASRVRKFAEKEIYYRRNEFTDNQVIQSQTKSFLFLRDEVERTTGFLKQGYGSDNIYLEIGQLIGLRKLAGEGVTCNKDKFQTVRNLTTTSILLKEILDRTNNRSREVLAHHKVLGRLQFRLDSLLTDTTLYRVPGDSAAIVSYFQKLTLLSKEIEPVRIPLRKALDSVQKIEVMVNQLKYGIESDISETESLRESISGNFGLIETGASGHYIQSGRTFNKIVRYSVVKAALVLTFYVVNHASILLLMILLIAGIAFYLFLLRRKIKFSRSFDTMGSQEQLFDYPVASAILIGLTIFQFFLPLPPFALSGLIWLISGIALTVIIRKSVPPFWYKAWLVIFILFLLGYTGNLLLWQSSLEGWTMFFFILAGLSTGIFLLLKRNRSDIPKKLLLVFIALMVLYELLALANFIAGGYNQAKTFMVTGVVAVVVSFFLYWTTSLAKRIIQYSIQIQKGPEDEYFPVADKQPAKKRPIYLYILFFTGCFILISRNFYFYQSMFEPMRKALVTTRTIGEFAFTYQSIFIFFLVLFLSGVVARIVSFFASENVSALGKQDIRGMGSWLLLIRMAIITLGVLLAFVSAGIPMDKFAIILGALSVGIGFGLQTLVNNLVSGLIIAFEKPVNVGDIVEIESQTGTMKSIGIRSSVVTTWDGADVIIPNGELLNKHLVNWTMGNSRRRFDLLVGVAYGTNLEKTHHLLLDLMVKDKRILKHPKPFVLVTGFNSSSVDLVLKFWVSHFSIGFEVKSDLIIAIDRLFREQGIIIPFPQQDVHIRSDPGQPANEETLNP